MKVSMAGVIGIAKVKSRSSWSTKTGLDVARGLEPVSVLGISKEKLGDKFPRVPEVPEK